MPTQPGGPKPMGLIWTLLFSRQVAQHLVYKADVEATRVNAPPQRVHYKGSPSWGLVPALSLTPGTFLEFYSPTHTLKDYLHI